MLASDFIKYCRDAVALNSCERKYTMTAPWELIDESTKCGGRNGIALFHHGREVAFYFKADFAIKGKTFSIPDDAPAWVAGQIQGYATKAMLDHMQEPPKERTSLSDADRDFLLKCVACNDNAAVDLRMVAVKLLLVDISRMRGVNSPAEKAEGKPSDALRDSGAPRGTFTVNARCPRCMKAMQKEIPSEPGDFPLSCCGQDFAIARLSVAIRGVQ